MVVGIIIAVVVTLVIAIPVTSLIVTSYHKKVTEAKLGMRTKKPEKSLMKL